MSWTDDEIIGAILAGAEASGRALVARMSFGYGFGHEEPERHGPVCAVSSGLLFAGLRKSESPIDAFAEKYGVSVQVARGVSWGFEGYNVEYYDDDYARGWAIGAAVRSAIESETP